MNETEKERRSPTDRAVPDRGVYATRVNSCGCRSVPDGQHLADCVYRDPASIAHAPACASCSYRGVRIAGVCPFCGAGEIDPSSSRVDAKRGNT